MVSVSYPGVYLQEKSSGVKTITGVSTSIAAFLGRASKGKMNWPVRCLSYANFIRAFGPPHPSSDLAVSVRQFFDNGGTDCYVVRVAKLAPPPALPALDPALASLKVQNYTAQDVLEFAAKAEGLWGAGLRLEVDYNTPTPDDTFSLRIFLEDGGRVVAAETFAALSMDPSSPRFAPTFVTQGSDLVLLRPGFLKSDGTLNTATHDAAALAAGFSQAGRLMDMAGFTTAVTGLFAKGKYNLDLSVDGSPYVTVDLRGAASAANLQTRINDALKNFPGVPLAKVEFKGAANDVLRLTADNGRKASVRVRRSSSHDIAEALMLGVEQGGIEVTRWSNLRPMATGALITAGDAADPVKYIGLHDAGSLPNLVQSDFNAQNLVIDGRNVLLSSLVSDPAVGSKWSKNKPGISPGTGDNDGLREKLKKIAELVNQDSQLSCRAESFGNHLVLLSKTGPVGNKSAIACTVAAATLLISANAATAWRPNDHQYALTGGNDGTAPELDTYVGDPLRQTGFHALDPVDLFNLMVIPADEEVFAATLEDVYGKASIYCQQRRAFLLADAPPDWTKSGLADVVNNTAKINTMRAKVVKDHSAVFYPRLVFNDRGLIRAGGASGAMAGLFARTDSTRGVWKAPAGTEADLRGISGFEVKLTDRENGVLNKLAVNCLRSFPSGFVSWGARTFDGMDDNPSDWKYIPIRRLALFLQESLYRGTQWAVFEPNDEPLWAKLRLNITAFMMSLYRQGAFQGSSPNEAFYVKCDADTTTQNDRNLGIVNVEIGFAPLKPAEFIIITIQQMAGDLK